MVEGVPSLRGRALSFELLRDDCSTAIAHKRALDPALPIGFLLDDESSVLAALSGGADDAAVLTMRSTPALLAFVDRFELRASLRADTQRLRAALVHSEKLTALGTLVAGVAHEINNPLSAILLSASALRRVLPGAPGSDAIHLLDELDSAGDAIAAIVRDLRSFTRADEQQPAELVDVPPLIDQVVRLLGYEASERCVIERDYSPELPRLVLQRSRLAQVLTNLLSNAAQAITEIARPEHSSRISVRADDESLAIAISDTGPGIAPDVLERIFDPFFTTKRHELGTGLGLSISRSIMRDLGGDLAVESVYGDGATFLALLPLPAEHALREARLRAPVGQRQLRPIHAETVLVVERDPRLRRAYARLLDREYRVLLAHAVSEAVELLESGSTPDLLVLDLDLPDREGADFLAWLEAHRPALRARSLLVSSAEAQRSSARRLEEVPGPLLLKPLHGAALLDALAELASG